MVIKGHHLTLQLLLLTRKLPRNWRRFIKPARKWSLFIQLLRNWRQLIKILRNWRRLIKRMRNWRRFIKLTRKWRRFIKLLRKGCRFLKFRRKWCRFCASGVDLQEIFSKCLRKGRFNNFSFLHGREKEWLQPLSPLKWILRYPFNEELSES